MVIPIPDLGLIHGELVRVRFRVPVPGGGVLGEDAFEVTERDVENVLVVPGPRADLPGVERPEGVRVVFNLHFPKTFEGSLRGADIQVRGQWYRVIGDPQAYTAANTPGAWNLPVEVETVKG